MNMVCKGDRGAWIDCASIQCELRICDTQDDSGERNI